MKTVAFWSELLQFRKQHNVQMRIPNSKFSEGLLWHFIIRNSLLLYQREENKDTGNCFFKHFIKPIKNNTIQCNIKSYTRRRKQSQPSQYTDSCLPEFWTQGLGGFSFKNNTFWLFWQRPVCWSVTVLSNIWSPDAKLITSKPGHLVCFKTAGLNICCGR